MKVLHIVPILSEAATYGGPARGAFRQARVLVSRGHDVWVLALSPDVSEPTRDEILGVRRHRFPHVRLPGHRFAGVFSVRAISWLRKHGREFDIVHVHAGRELFPLIGMCTLRSFGVPIVLQTHGMLSPRKGPIHRVYDRILTRPAVTSTRAVMSLTSYEDAELAHFAIGSSITRLVNGVDDPLEAPAVAEGSDLKIVFASRIHPRKRAIDLLHAVEFMRSDAPESAVTFYGPDEGALGELEQAIIDDQASGFAKYGGILPYERVRDALRGYNVFVLPSINEPFPNALLEAMANGMAVVCTSSCGLAPYIESAGAGLVVEPGVEPIAGALRRLALEPGLRKELGIAALKLVREEFSMSAVGDRLEEIYAGASQ